MAVEETASRARVLPRYARLLGASQGRAQREASAAARACLVAMRFRFPEALVLVELVIRLGEVGAFDLIGTIRQIGERIGELLGEPPPDAVRLQRAMRAVAGRTCLVERQSRQLWRLCLAGISDPASPRHRSLLAETPSPYRLGAVAEARSKVVGGDERAERAGLRERLEAAAARLRAAEAERDGARIERDELARRVRAVETELAQVGGERDDFARQLRDARTELAQMGDEIHALRREREELEQRLRDSRAELAELGVGLDTLRRERDEAMQVRRDQAAELDRERDELAGRMRDQEVLADETIAELRAVLAARDEELRQERERRRIAEEALAVRPEQAAPVAEQSTRAEAERRELEDLVLDREVALEAAGRELAALRAELAAKDAAAREQQLAAETARKDEAARSAGLRGFLKEERERRRSVEGRLRRLQVALRVKLGGREELTEVDLARDEVILGEIRRVLEEHTLAQQGEREALARETEPDHERLAELDQDVQLGRILGRMIAQAVLDAPEGRDP